MNRALLALACSSTLAGCFLTHPIEKPTAQVRTVAVGSVSFSGIDGSIDLDVQNPNAFAVPLSEIDYQLSVGGAQAVSGRIELSQTIPARGVAPVHATLHIDPRDAIGVGEQLMGGARDYTLAARLTFTTRLGSVDVAVQQNGQLGS
jgi:LEA14-like dessication related protein